MAVNLIKKVLHKEETTSINLSKIADIINQGYVNNANETTGYSKKKSFAPSKLVWNEGACPRYWYLAFEGNEFENKSDGPGIANMQAGTASHKRIGEALKNSGIVKWLEQAITHDDPPIYGFGDGMFTIDGEDILIEIKTTNDQNFQYRKQSMTPTKSNKLQLLIYMKILKHGTGAIIYENKNTNELLVVPVVPTKEDVEEVESTFQWMRDVRQAFIDKKLPERVSRQGTKFCSSCPLEKVCDSRPKGDIKIEKRKDFE
ncbi:MAG: CRISPR-associated protein Cas4 [Sediminibacterium sp.]